LGVTSNSKKKDKKKGSGETSTLILPVSTNKNEEEMVDMAPTRRDSAWQIGKKGNNAEYNTVSTKDNRKSTNYGGIGGKAAEESEDFEESSSSTKNNKLPDNSAYGSIPANTQENQDTTTEGQTEGVVGENPSKTNYVKMPKAPAELEADPSDGGSSSSSSE